MIQVDNDEIMIFDFDFNEDNLLLEYEKFIKDAVEYEDNITPKLDFWLVARGIEFDSSERIQEIFGVRGKPRFYNLKAESEIPMHTDRGTLCSLNIILDGDESAPVDYSSGNSYHYKVALLNTTLMHGVKNGKEERKLFKLSFFENTFEEMKDIIREAIA